MFNLDFKDHDFLEEKHKEWCVSHSALPTPNPHPTNEFIDWLYSIQDDIYTLKPRDMLEALSNLIRTIQEGNVLNPMLFNALFESNFLFWELQKKQNVFCFVFSWPEGPGFQRIKSLLVKRASRRANSDLEDALRAEGLLDELTNVLSGTEGNSLFQKAKKYLQHDGNIKIPVESVLGNNNFYDFVQFCSNHFNYKKFSSQREGWGPYPLIDELRNTVCPYCNRSYTHSVFEDDIFGGRPELDHFLSKSFFPFFALSVYNLIPVCHSCNHAKLDKHVVKITDGQAEYTHLHPNVAEDNVLNTRMFETEQEGDLLTFLMQNDFSLRGKIRITGNCKARTKVKNSLELYKLAFNGVDERLIGYYTDHYKDIERTLNLVKQYPQSAIESIAELVKEDSKTLQRVFVENLVSESPWEEPLGKLKSDLLESIVSSLDFEAEES
ncbi:putative HNH nuclease domain-containing protein [Vibrio crassostreae]|nr:putative HNH nuclease domain-containing protein [Vibrio crassostreae]CAK4026834.1 putative HNH nuclease domain-containing protein [Vibrio crassostreae]